MFVEESQDTVPDRLTDSFEVTGGGLKGRPQKTRARTRMF